MMTSNAPSNKNVEWAVETFRSLLQALHIQNISNVPTMVKTADFRNLIVKGMGRCIITAQRQKISDGQKGYCVFTYRKTENLYILSIVVDEQFFSDDSLSLRTQRKALAIHEFVHCVAIMLSLSLLGSGPNLLIERFKKILDEKLTVTTSDDFVQLLKALGTISKNTDSQKPTNFNDKHFRTGFEDFPDDYADLYLNFLFSYKLLREIVTTDKMRTFKKFIITKDVHKLAEFVESIISEIVEKKALDRTFVFNRFLYFLPRLAADMLQSL